MKKSIFLILIVAFAFSKANSQSLPKVKIETSVGKIIVELDTINAPISALNFLKHVEMGTYENAVFYRVVRMDNQPQNDVKIEVVQGGVFIDSLVDVIPPIVHETTLETGLKHIDGTLSMTRYGAGTANTEFSICVGNQPNLDFGGKRNPDGQGFAAFGQVLEGMDVVRKIQKQNDEGQMLVDKVGFTVYSIK